MAQSWCVVAPLATILSITLQINTADAGRPDARLEVPHVTVDATSGDLGGSSLLRRSRVKQQSPDNDVTAAFAAFIENYGRPYKPGDSEYEHRFQLFATSFAEMQLQNSKPNREWNAAINQFSDRSQEEVEALNGWRGRSSAAKRAGSTVPGFQPHSSSALVQLVQQAQRKYPPELNYLHLWTAKKIRQQMCADCWAAATVSMLEAHAEIHMGIHRTFSERELALCTPDPWKCGGDGQCAGSTSELALEQVLLRGLSDDENNKKCPEERGVVADPNENSAHEWGPGVRRLSTENPRLGEMPEVDSTEADVRPRRYPGFTQQSVKTVGDHLTTNKQRTSPSLAFGMYAWERLPENKYWPVIHALVTRGPLAVAVSTDWQNFGDGVHGGCNKAARIGHAVLLIGYGQIPQGPKYWAIQNSWGESWGDHGHIRLKRADTPELEEAYCGNDTDPQEGTTCENGPPSVKVCGQCGILYDVTVPYFESKTDLSRQMAMSRGEHV
mmetsp:Transcript_52650/g.104544  ORF Transcript_52650/g.104544 Transcript_52650/m.104544 type:complete len:498 (-) Transcript_52650:76-1569(-)|eukprot:CAMPEP_0172727864 /NCGR_PEP_ID=MMETSP1074-20121228/91912_1 /TAXON_ID=2916 /ORGANISM="Ceratium fusus, Strain PA161109" /LENGTH=497 /DNA_ID=CAMNT_0013555045 /DNA_START=56 /DNA_END=1549 /DNA_ORIENTATION=-